MLLRRYDTADSSPVMLGHREHVVERVAGIDDRRESPLVPAAPLCVYYQSVEGARDSE